jgi:hypothetical protein
LEDIIGKDALDVYVKEAKGAQWLRLAGTRATSSNRN